jgi:CheY-like chemotaxis protein
LASSGAPPSGRAHSRGGRSLSKVASSAFRRRILVVDDDARVAQTITRILSRDYEVTVVDRASAAIELVASGIQFDAILSDVKMPGMSGADFYARLEREWPEVCAKIVFLTGGAESAAEQAFLAGSGCPWLEKPFAIDDLRRMIQSVVD